MFTQLRRALGRQNGFSVLETMMAAVLVASTATGTFFALDSATQSSERNQRATVAHEVALNEIERLRRLGDSNLPTLLAQNNTQVVKTVEGVNYTATIEAYYKTGIGTEFTNACGDEDTTGGAQYVYLGVVVEYPGVHKGVSSGTGAVDKATVDTYFATEGGDLQTATGTLRVYLKDATNTALNGRTVQLYKMPANTLIDTETSNSYGCVLFTGLARSDYEVRIPTTTEVDKYGSTNPVKLTVKMPTRGALTKIINLSAPVTLNLSWYTRLTPSDPTKTYVTPSSSPLSSLVGPFVAMNPDLLNPPSGYTFRTHASNLKFYPMTDGYSLYAGSCIENDPDDGNAGNGDERFLIPASGSSGWQAGFTYTPNPELLVPQLRIRVAQSSSSTYADDGWVRVRMIGTTCGAYPSGGATNWIQLTGDTDANGYLANNAYVLPAGTYEVCVKDYRWRTTWPWGYVNYYGYTNNVSNSFPGPNNYTHTTTSTTPCGGW